MLKTTELRWFCQGPLPDTVERWFQQDCPGESPEPLEEREDLYLLTAGCEHLSAKLRQEKLEIKWRGAELGALQLAKESEGQAEEWLKWICADLTAERIVPEAIVATGPWVKVAKARSQRKYQVFPDQSLAVVPVNQSIDQGCTVELTQLKITGKSWWSIAFEASGKANNLRGTLQPVARWVLTTYPGPKLRLRDSYAYPKWLSIIVP